MKRFALIPAYKPDRRLNDLIDQLQANGFETVIVDDGSGLDYRDIFDDIDYTVLRHPTNYGKGHALKTGIDFIRRNCQEDYVIVTADADGQHTVKDIIRVAETAEEFPESLILGSRADEGDIPLRSRIGHSCTRAVFKLAGGVYVHDTQTGLRAFTNALTDRMLEIDGERYEYEMNVLMSCADCNVPIREVPILTVYEKGNPTSHFSPVKDSFKIYKVIAKFCASSLISFAADMALFLILQMLIPIQAANIGARIFSGTLNYTLNHRAVFKSSKPMEQTAVQYFLLALFILAANTLLLTMFTSGFGVSTVPAKIMTEMIMFVVSFGVQKLFIFGEGRT